MASHRDFGRQSVVVQAGRLGPQARARTHNRQELTLTPLFEYLATKTRNRKSCLHCCLHGYAAKTRQEWPAKGTFTIDSIQVQVTTSSN